MRSVISLCAAVLLGAAPAPAQQREVIHGPGEVQGLPFSMAVRVGTVLYLSGQIGNVPGTRQLADTGITGQTHQALENVKAVLAAAASSLDRVVKCTVFLVDIREDERGVRELFPEGSPGPVHGGGQRARARRAGGDRVPGGGRRMR